MAAGDEGVPTTTTSDPHVDGKVYVALKTNVYVVDEHTKYVVPTSGPNRPVTSLKENICPTRSPWIAVVVSVFAAEAVYESGKRVEIPNVLGVICGDASVPPSAKDAEFVSRAAPKNAHPADAPTVRVVRDGVEHT